MYNWKENTNQHNAITVLLIDLFRKPRILKLILKDMYASVAQRPVNNAVQWVYIVGISNFKNISYV